MPEAADMAPTLRRVQGEFLEMPGLCLTLPQARRLWGLDTTACECLLRTLVDANFLYRTNDGAYMRVESFRAHRSKNTIAAA